jgi:hypothetical protein
MTRLKSYKNKLIIWQKCQEGDELRLFLIILFALFFIADFISAFISEEARSILIIGGAIVFVGGFLLMFILANQSNKSKKQG